MAVVCLAEVLHDVCASLGRVRVGCHDGNLVAFDAHESLDRNTTGAHEPEPGRSDLDDEVDFDVVESWHLFAGRWLRDHLFVMSVRSP